MEPRHRFNFGYPDQFAYLCGDPPPHIRAEAAVRSTWLDVPTGFSDPRFPGRVPDTTKEVAMKTVLLATTAAAQETTATLRALVSAPGLSIVTAIINLTLTMNGTGTETVSRIPFTKLQMVMNWRKCCLHSLLMSIYRGILLKTDPYALYNF